MKEIIALLVFLIIAGLSTLLAARERIGNALLVILLAFSLIAGWMIANYDRIQGLQWEVLGHESFRKQIQLEKGNALAEVKNALDNMRKEVEEGRQSIRLAVSEASDLRNKIREERSVLDSALENFRQIEASMKNEERNIKELRDRSDEIRQQIAAIHEASSELALSLTRLTWLLMEARKDYGAERADLAVQHIMNQLDEIVGVVIDDPKARAEFVAEVMNSVPPRQQR
ncbi:MAG: hypothetical protein AB2L11_12360 [Syntrophobacteraceae bacterium]